MQMRCRVQLQIPDPPHPVQTLLAQPQSEVLLLWSSRSISLSSLFVKVQEFGSSCFTFRKTGNKGPSPAAVPKSAKASSSSSTRAKAISAKDMKSEKKEASDPLDAQLVDKDKPLRKRLPEPSAPTILPAKTVVGNVNDDKKEADIHKVNQKFILADKYRPKALKDFICNRSEATRLQALVKYGGYDHVLCEADKLSTDALPYIRWLLERYKGHNKVFFCCSDVSKLQPLMSVCTLIQLLPPSKEEIVEVPQFIAGQEGIHLPHKLAEKIADSSKNKLRQAIRSFEACWHSSYPFKEYQVILTGWEEDIANIAKNMVEERSRKQLYIIRGKLQILIEHDLSPDFIFMSLVGEVKKHLPQNLHPEVYLYDEYNRNDESMIESEDEIGTKVVDPVKKNMRIFLRIEARFMNRYNNQSRMANPGNTPLAGEGTSW